MANPKDCSKHIIKTATQGKFNDIVITSIEDLEKYFKENPNTILLPPGDELSKEDLQSRSFYEKEHRG